MKIYLPLLFIFALTACGGDSKSGDKNTNSVNNAGSEINSSAETDTEEGTFPDLSINQDLLNRFSRETYLGYNVSNENLSGLWMLTGELRIDGVLSDYSISFRTVFSIDDNNQETSITSCGSLSTRTLNQKVNVAEDIQATFNTINNTNTELEVVINYKSNVLSILNYSASAMKMSDISQTTGNNTQLGTVSGAARTNTGSPYAVALSELPVRCFWEIKKHSLSNDRAFINNPTKLYMYSNEYNQDNKKAGKITFYVEYNEDELPEDSTDIVSSASYIPENGKFLNGSTLSTHQSSLLINSNFTTLIHGNYKALVPHINEFNLGKEFSVDFDLIIPSR